MPKPPVIITALDIATRLVGQGGRASKEFLKAVQRNLRELREDKIVQSVPVGKGTQLGWHLPGIVRSAPSAAPTLGVRRQAQDLPTVTAMRVAGNNRRVPHVGLLHKVLALVPMAPESITSSALVNLIEVESTIPTGQARKAVQTQLRELQLRQLVRAVRVEGDQLGWYRHDGD